MYNLLASRFDSARTGHLERFDRIRLLDLVRRNRFKSLLVLADTSGDELAYDSSGPWVNGVDGVALVEFHLDA